MTTLASDPSRQHFERAVQIVGGQSALARALGVKQGHIWHWLNKAGSRALLVEDLATDGGSKIVFVNGMRAAGLKVTDVFVVFFYGAFSGAIDTLQEAGVRLHWLATWRDVLKVAEEGQYFPKAAVAGVRAFLDDPVGWSRAHGGKGVPD